MTRLIVLFLFGAGLATILRVITFLAASLDALAATSLAASAALAAACFSSFLTIWLSSDLRRLTGFSGLETGFLVG